MLLAITTNIANAQSDCSCCSKKTQSENLQHSSTADEGNPIAVVTFKTNRTVSPLIEQINKLTNYDEVLTEKVIYQLSMIKNQSFNAVVKDEDYETLTIEVQQSALKESEVREIINQIRD